jgi:hypothetical protein
MEKDGVSWVGQKHKFGCMAATAAMILGLDYEAGCHVITRHPESLDHGGNSYFVLDSQLAERGYAIARKYAVMQPGNVKRSTWPCGPWAKIHWCEVMTSDDATTSHAVVMLSDGTVLDPATPEPRRLTDYPKVNFVAAVTRIPA